MSRDASFGNRTTKVDENAVQVRVGDVMIGHLPAGVAARPAPALDGGEHREVTVSDVVGHAVHRDRPEARLSLRRVAVGGDTDQGAGGAE
jgi:hypothetical protein